MTLEIIKSRTVVMVDLPMDVKVDAILFEKAVRASMEYYSKMHGKPLRVWVNPKDAPDGIEYIDGIKIERRGGCVRGKVMVM